MKFTKECAVLMLATMKIGLLAQSVPTVVQSVKLLQLPSPQGSCRYFSEKTYDYGKGQPSLTFISFNRKDGDDPPKIDSMSPTKFVVKIEDTSVPYATRQAGDDILTIHMSNAEYGTESTCLKGVPLSH